MRRFGLVAVALMGMAMSASIVRADDDWKEPKDGLFTEKQVENYAAAHKELMDMLKAMGKAVEGSKNGSAAILLAAGMDDKINAIVAKHGLKRAEYDWLNNKITESMGAAMLDEMMEKAKADVAEQKKKMASDVEAAQKKVADYEKASKEGKRVLTKEQRDDLIKSSKEAQDSAAEEAKQHAQEAKEAADEAAKAEADAKASDGLAKNPPPDVDKDSREDYIKGKKEEAESFRTAAKESRDKEKEARKAEAESKAKVAAAAKQRASPETPVSDEEKAQVKKDNDDGLAAAKSELSTTMQAQALLADSEGQFKKQEAELHKDIKEPNIALVKKHLKEIQDAWGMNDKK